MGLFGIKKESEVEKEDNSVFFNTPPQDDTFQYNENSTVLAPQPEVLESNIQSQNTTYMQQNVAPLTASAPSMEQVNTIKPSVSVSSNQVPSVSTPQQVQVEQAVQTTPVQPVQTSQEVKEEVEKLDALNNSTNPVPVNPVATVQETVNYADVEVKPMDCINLVINSLIKPGTAMENEGNKYRDNMVALKVTLYITGMALVVRLLTGFVAGCFATGYNLATGATYTHFDPNNIANISWLGLIVSALMVSGVSIAIVSGVYYLFSFIRSKGIAYGRYLMVTNIGFIPFIVGLTVLYPLGGIISSFLGLCLLGVSLIYTLVSFISGINNLLSIESVNKNIIYNVINLGSIFVVIMVIVFKVFYADIINAISLIH